MTIYIDPNSYCVLCNERPISCSKTSLCRACHLLEKSFGHLDRWNGRPAPLTRFEALKHVGSAFDHDTPEFERRLREWLDREEAA